MSLEVGTLSVTLEAQTNDFLKQFAGAMKQVDAFAAQMKRVSQNVAQVSGVLSAVGGAAIALASTVDGPTKSAMEGLKKSTELLAVQVSDTLLPAIKTLSLMVRDAAQWFANLSPGVKGAISDFAVVAVQIGAAAKVLSLIAGLVSSAAGALSALASAVAAIGIGPLLAIVVAIGLIVAAIVLWHKAWRENGSAIQQIIKDVAEYLGNAFGEAFKFIGDLIKKSMSLLERWIFLNLDAVDALQKLSGVKLIDVAGMKDGIHGLLQDLGNGQFFSVALKFGKDTGAQIVDGFTSEIGRIKDELSKALGLGGGKNNALIGLGRGAAQQYRMHGEEFGEQGVYGMTGTSAYKAANTADAYLNSLSDPLSKLADSMKVLAHGITEATASSRQINATDTYRSTAQLSGPVSNATRGRSAVWDGGALDKIWEGIKSAAQSFGKNVLSSLANIGTAFAIAGRSLVSKLGELGNVISAAIAGFQEGGIWGAIAAALIELLSRSKAFTEVINTSNESLSQILTAFEPAAKALGSAITTLISALLPVIEAVIGILTPLLEGLAKGFEDAAPILTMIAVLLKGLTPIFTAIGQIMKAFAPAAWLLFQIVKVVVTVILAVVWVIESIWNTFIDSVGAVVSRVAGIFGEQAEKDTMAWFQSMKADTKPTEDALAFALS